MTGLGQAWACFPLVLLTTELILGCFVSKQFDSYPSSSQHNSYWRHLYSNYPISRSVQEKWLQRKANILLFLLWNFSPPMLLLNYYTMLHFTYLFAYNFTRNSSQRSRLHRLHSGPYRFFRNPLYWSLCLHRWSSSCFQPHCLGGYHKRDGVDDFGQIQPCQKQSEGMTDTHAWFTYSVNGGNRVRFRHLHCRNCK